MKRLAAILLVLLAAIALPLQAQDSAADKSFLESWLETNLSAAGREVRVTGFTGALSSRATIEEITIADDDGVWFTLRGAVLDWTRSALLKGRLEIGELSAEEIEITRRPAQNPGGPSAELSDFALPDLPVAIQIGRVAAGTLRLGEGVLGTAAVLAFDGAGGLEGGAGDISLRLERIDGAEGAFSVDGAYANDTRLLRLDLDLSEGPGGIVAGLTRLPGGGAVALRIAGEGPVDTFTADVVLATEGVSRVAGRVALLPDGAALDGVTPAQRFHAELSGDPGAMLPADYRPFFGADTRLVLDGRRESGGAFELSSFVLSTGAMTLEGAGALNALGWPERAQIAGQIVAPEGGTVLLPVGGEKTGISRAALSFDYDAAKGDSWSGALRLENLTRPGFALSRAELSGNGRLLAGAGAVPFVSGKVAFAAEGIASGDEALQAALGQVLAGRLTFERQSGAPLKIDELELAGEDYGLSGNATLEVDWRRLDLVGDGAVTLEARDMARFDGLAGRPLSGAARLDIVGDWALPGGAFDFAITGRGRDLGIEDARIDRLFAGESTLSIALSRGDTGTRIERFDIKSPGASVTASGQMNAGSGRIEAAVEITDGAALAPGLSGAFAARGVAVLGPEGWQIDASAAGPGGTSVAVAGLVAGNGAGADLTLEGQAPLDFLNSLIEPRQVSGVAGFQLRLKGPIALASLEGVITAGDARLSMPSFHTALEPVAVRVDIAGGAARVDATAGVSTGGRLAGSGRIGLAAPYESDLDFGISKVTVVDPSLYEAVLDGALRLTGPIAGGAAISGQIDLATVELRLPETGFGVDGALEGIEHIAEPAGVRATRARAGLIAQGEAAGAMRPYALDILLNAPARIFLRGRGLDAEFGGSLRIGGTSADILAEGGLKLVRGRLDVLGKRLALTEGEVTLRGSFNPYLRLVAASQSEDILVQVVLEGRATEPVVSFTSQPPLPEDEVLAHLFFGRGIGQISPFQALRLASAVATLSGRGGADLIGRLRNVFRLDDLEVTTDATGAVAIRGGTYVTENIYADVTIGADGRSEVNLNLALTPDVTAKGSLSQDGNSAIGVFFERDY